MKVKAARDPRVHRAIAAVLLLLPLVSAQEERLLWDHGPHSQPTSDERTLRDLLARYERRDHEDAVRGALTKPPRWIAAAVDATVRRIEEDIKYHRRSENRLDAARDERIGRYLRADRLNVLRLSAALQLDISLALTEVDAVGWLVVGSERSIDRLYALRTDFEQNGPIPWPISVDEPWEPADGRAAKSPGSADWPAVRAYLRRWYAAAASRLQALVELQLAPALIARGLERFPVDSDLLLARGSFVETRLALSQVDASLSRVLYDSDVRARWREELTSAERDHEHAMQAAGPASEAAIRLARVRLLNGQPERARELLDRILAGDPRAEIRYLALLFRAAAAERLGDHRAAARDYEAAVTCMPGTQTPMLALGRLADEGNRPAGARQWVERALASPEGVADPWRGYIKGQGWLAGERIAGLRSLGSR